MSECAGNGVPRQIDASQAHLEDPWTAACARAESVIVQQLVEVFEGARQAQGLTLAQVTARSRLSKRTVGLIRHLRVCPSLRTLIALAEAHGLELSIRVRSKRVRTT